MQVALVAETFSPAVNGVVNSVLRVAEELVARGHQPVIVAPSGDSYRSASGAPIPVVTVPSVRVPGYRQLEVGRPGVDLSAVLGEINPDVVHCASPAVLGAAAVRACRLLDLPSVAVYQTDLAAFARRYGFGSSTALIWSRLRRIHNAADVTLAPSTASAAQLRRAGINNVALWPRGVDPIRFNPAHRDEALRYRLGDGRLVVGYLGRLAREKRIDMLEPISRLEHVQLVIVGAGPCDRQLRRLMPRATFTGQMTGAALGQLLASFDLLVHPGADETFCQVVQEALCSGVPVVATAAGGPLDLVRHQHNGLLWQGQDADELADLVTTLVYSPADLARLRAAARASVAWRTWAYVTEALLSHYAYAVSRHNRQPETAVTRRPAIAASAARTRVVRESQGRSPSASSRGAHRRLG